MGACTDLLSVPPSPRACGPALGAERSVQFLLLEPCAAHEAVLAALHRHADVAAIHVAGLSALAAMAAARTCARGMGT